MQKLYFSAIFLIIFSGTSAQPGSLDQSFAHDGIRKFDLRINALTEEGKTVLNLPNGKKIVVFTSNGYTKLTRLHSNGKTDLSFGEDGFSVAVNIEAVNAVISKQGKIVIAGASDSASGIARFNANGRLDRNFHHDGLLTGIDFHITDLADYFDGKLVVIGDKKNEHGLIVARYLSNGTADPSFDVDGRTILNVNNNSNYAGAFVAVLPDGKILTAFAPESLYSPSGFDLIRLKTNGSIDEDFGTGGEVISVFGFSWPKALLLQPDGKILVAGYYSYPSDLIMVRYKNNGIIDSSFGEAGITTTDLRSSINSIALKTDGKIVVAGGTYHFVDYENNYTSTAMQFNSNGSVDDSFGDNGIVNVDVGGFYEYFSGISTEPDGSITLCGTQRGLKDDWQYHDFVVCKLSANGVLDPKFANKGVLIGSYPSNSTSFTHAVVQPGGKLVVAGELSNEMDTAFLMMRLNLDGSPDQSFGNNGIVTTLASLDGDRITRQPFTLQLQPDGKIIVSGVNHRYSGRSYRYNTFALTRYSPDGQVDYDVFASTGGIISPYWHVLSTWVILKDSVTLVLAYKDTIGRRDFSITKLPPPPRGYPIVFTTFLGSLDYITAMAVQPDNKILVAGRRNVDNRGTDFSITRLNADGSLDLSFGNGGKQITGFEKNDDGITSLVIQPDGKIVAAGYSRNPKSGKSNFSVIRYNADGSLDAGFHSDGKQLVDFYGGAASVNSIALEPDGKIILGGVVGNTNPGNHHHDFKSSLFAIARLQPNGFIDHEFGKKGRVITNTSHKPDILSAVVVSGNRLYATGVNEDRFDLNSSEGIVSAYRLYCDDMQQNTQENITSATIKISEETNKQLSIQVAPNPGRNYFVVTIKSSSNRPVSYRVTDAVGRLVEHKTGISADQSFQIGAAYQPGIYFIQVTQNGSTKQLKLVKLGN